MYHALSFISPQQGFSSQPLWQSCPRGKPWSSQWQYTRECSCSPWSSGTCQRLPPTRFQDEWEPPSCQLKGVAVDSGLGKPVPWHQHWERLTTTKPQFCKIITYSPQPQLPKLLLPSDRSPRPAASSNPDFFSAGSFSTMCRNGLINLSSTLMMIWQGIFSILGDTDKTGSPRNTRIPEEIYKHATSGKQKHLF